MTEAKRVCIAFAIGCPRNQADTALLTSYFHANGWTLVQQAQNADLVVVSTCGFTTDVEEESVRLVSLLHEKRRKESKLIVVGCLAGINPDRVTQPFNAMAIRPADIHCLDQLIEATIPLQNVPPVNCVEPRILTAKTCWPIREACPSLPPPAAMKHQTKRRLLPPESHGNRPLRYADGTKVLPKARGRASRSDLLHPRGQRLTGGVHLLRHPPCHGDFAIQTT